MNRKYQFLYMVTSYLNFGSSWLAAYKHILEKCRAYRSVFLNDSVAIHCWNLYYIRNLHMLHLKFFLGAVFVLNVVCVYLNIECEWFNNIHSNILGLESLLWLCSGKSVAFIGTYKVLTRQRGWKIDAVRSCLWMSDFNFFAWVQQK